MRLILGFAILFTYLVMIWGGVVRSTDSGLACPSWPLCYGDFSPPKETSAKLEMGHRTVSSLAGLFVLLTFIYVWKHFKGLPRLTSALALLFTVSAALTGMKMIKSEAPNLKYVSHMLLESFHIYESMLILGFLVLTYRFIQKDKPTGDGIPLWAYAFALTTGLVPVHYHGAVTSLTLALMGISYHLVKEYGWVRDFPKVARFQLFMYGFGMVLFILGLYFAGFKGAPRKTYGTGFTDDPFVLLSLGLMMVGTVFAVIGGVVFVISMLRISLKGRYASISAN